MPISSHQVSGMIGGQQAMFGNFASYSQQISPGFQGQPPAYSNPMAGSGASTAFAPPPEPMHNPASMAGPQVMSAIGNIGLPALGTAGVLGGMMLPGMAGQAAGRLDPFSGALGGFARGAGLRSGGAEIMSNMGRIASGGMGSVARAGLGGIGGAVAGALPAVAIGQAAQYGVSQAVQGAQFQNQVQGTLNQNFRFQNAQSRSGYGFSREQGGDIASMVREMGHSDMMTGPQELLRVMKSGSQQGLFRAVQDVKEFKKRFTDMVGSLKEVAKTMNTTLEGAMPFFSQARQMGFWTPDDVSRNAQQTRQTASNAGLSVAQTQQMMGQGAQMARSVGAMGTTGAQGMGQSLELVGGGLRGGTFSERELSEATGGLQGGQAVQSMAGTLQAATTRFAGSRRARWMLASMGENKFTSLNAGKMQDMMAGTMSLGDIGRGARRNIQKQGKFNFVNNEKELRGELVKQGPEAQLGFIRTMIGGRIYGDDPKSKTITRRLMKRYFGADTKQADILTKMAREAPQIRRANVARTQAGLDQKERDQAQIMDKSWEGLKRKMSSWWDKSIKDPIQQFGADVSQDIGDFFEKAGDKMWGRTPTRHRLRGIGGLGMAALQRSAMGDTRIMEETFGKAGDLQKMLGSSASGLGASGGIAASLRGGGGKTGIGKFFASMTGMDELSTDKMDTLEKMGATKSTFASRGARDRAVREKGLLSGGRSVGGEYHAFDKEQTESLSAGLSAGVAGGVYNQRQATALGFADVKSATTAIGGAREELGASAEYKRRSADLSKKHSGWELGEAQVKDIMEGEGYSPGLKKYIGGAKDTAGRVNRLAAAQTKKMSGERGGVDLAKEAKSMGIGTWSGMEDLGRQIGERVDEAALGLSGAIGALDPEADLASKALLVGKRGMGPNPDAPKTATPEVMANLEEQGGDKYRRAMTLMASGSNEKEIAENKAKARDMFADLARDSKFKNTDEGATLDALASGSHPNSGNIAKAAAGLGKTYKLRERAKFAEATVRRSNRLFRNMGDQEAKIMGTMDKIKAKGGGTSLGTLLRGLRDTLDPEVYKKKMEQITELASQADPDQIANAAAIFGSQGGGEGIEEVLKGGRLVGDMTNMLTGKSSKDQATGANMLVGGMLGKGKHISPDQMKTIMAGGASGSTAAQNRASKLIDKITENAPQDNQVRVRELLNSIKSKDITGIASDAKEQVTARGIGTSAAPGEDILLAGAKNLRKDIDVLGHQGSPKGMHAELTRQSGLLQNIMRATEAIAGTTPQGPPQEAPK